MHYTINLLSHVYTIKACAEKLGFGAAINPFNMALDIRKGDLKVRFQPRFFYYDEEKQRRTITYYMKPEARGFIGWLPYFNKVWPTSTDKLAFKVWCKEQGLRTPEWWTTPSKEVIDYLVKRKNGSLGIGVRGPYRRIEANDPYHQLVEGEFYERFHEGRIAKVWYWNTEPVCLELLDFPSITGDGKRSIRALLDARVEASLGAYAHTAPWPLIEPVITYQGMKMTDVLPANKTIPASFRYASVLEGPNPRNRNVVSSPALAPLVKELAAAGQKFWSAIPGDIRQGVLYSVDAVLDAKNQLWFLEVNPNPGVHPDCYEAMATSLLAKRVSQVPSLEKAVDNAEHLKGGLVWVREPAKHTTSDALAELKPRGT